jgi:hypothetical protein
LNEILNEESTTKESVTELIYSFDKTQKMDQLPLVKHENDDENLFTSKNQQDQAKSISNEATSNSITEKHQDVVTSTLSIKKASNKFLYKLKKSKQNSLLTRNPQLPKSEIELRMNGTIKDNSENQEEQEESIDNSNSNSKLIVTEEVILGVPKETEIVLSKSNNKITDVQADSTSPTSTNFKNDETSIKLRTTTNPIARILGGNNKSSDQSELDVLLQIDSRNDSILSKFIKRLITNNNNNHNKAN